ncbi:hypothetical protein [Paracoccus alkanivorans]|uniref:hypothetical protein n=1 Tax=Paracoccus alkanivorans TaxID=2116655 RepID=UPI001FB5CDF2|nr:hypothetical protein [Paracoccus alkanivorans]
MKIDRGGLTDPMMIGSEHLSSGCFHEGLHISIRLYARLVRDWVSSIGLEPAPFLTCSMRRNKITHIYRKTGDPCTLQILLGHTKVDSTVRYLGVELEDALVIAESAGSRDAGCPHFGHLFHVKVLHRSIFSHGKPYGG